MRRCASLVACAALACTTESTAMVRDEQTEVYRELDAGFARFAAQARAAHMRYAPPEPFALRRRALPVEARWGKDGAWLERAGAIVAPRVALDALPRGSLVDVWTLGDELVAVAIPGTRSLFAVLAHHDGVLQWFDENGVSVSARFVRAPLRDSYIVSGFGVRADPFHAGRTQMHPGLDFAADFGARVYAIGDGRVVTHGENASAGRHVVIEHFNGWRSRYFHLSRLADVDVGQRVQAGETIGRVGSTGMSTGPHLHFELEIDGARVDPARIRWPRALHLTRDELRAHRAVAARLRAMTEADVLTAWPDTAVSSANADDVVIDRPGTRPRFVRDR